MPAQGTYDAETIRQRLTDWVATKVPDGSDFELGEIGAPGETGFSSETMLIDVAWTERGRRVESGWVVRTRPSGHTVFPEYDLHAQVRCMQLVKEHTDVPVPEILWWEPDESVLGEAFYVMRTVTGDVPSDSPPYTMQGFLFDASAEEQRRFYEGSIRALAGIHSIDVGKVDFSFLDRGQYGAVGLDQQFGFYDYYLKWAAQGRPQPTVEAALDYLKSNRPEGSDALTLNWGDARVSNIMAADFNPVAVLDWEMATLGPAEVDIGWFTYLNRFSSKTMGVEPLAGWMNDDETVALYEQLSGRKVHDLHYYQVWAGVRFGVIFIRLIQRMEQEGTGIPGWTETNNIVTQLLAEVAGLPAPE